MFGCLLSILAMVYYSSGVIWRFNPDKSLVTLSTPNLDEGGVASVQAGGPLVEGRSQRIIIILLISLDAVANWIGGRERQPKA